MKPKLYAGLAAAASHRELTREEMVSMVMLLRAERARGINRVPQDLASIVEAPSAPAQTTIMLARLNGVVAASGGKLRHWTDLASPEMLLMAGLFADSPGRAVQWAYAIAYWSAEARVPLTLENFSLGCCPSGPPDDAACRAAWAAQKGEYGNITENYLDTAEAWSRLAEVRCS